MHFYSYEIHITFDPCFLQEAPPPGSYDVQQSYELSQLHREKAKPRTEAASRKHGSFLSAASRFAPPRDVVISKADLDNPGKQLLTHYSRMDLPTTIN